jgi:hypothetical protein
VEPSNDDALRDREQESPLRERERDAPFRELERSLLPPWLRPALDELLAYDGTVVDVDTASWSVGSSSQGKTPLASRLAASIAALAFAARSAFRAADAAVAAATSV